MVDELGAGGDGAAGQDFVGIAGRAAAALAGAIDGRGREPDAGGAVIAKMARRTLWEW